MGHFKINPRDIFFILNDQLDYGRLCELDRYRDLDRKTLDLLVTEAIGCLRPGREIIDLPPKAF